MPGGPDAQPDGPEARPERRARDPGAPRQTPAHLLVFLDGVGVGPDDASSNPLARIGLPSLEGRLGRRLVDSGLRSNRSSTPGSGSGQGSQDREPARWMPLDATLGLPGLPQSGTGQTSLLTGVNAAALLGQHSGPYPGARLRGLLAEGNLFGWLRQAGGSACLANAYPERYLVRAAGAKARMGAFARAAQLGGIPLLGPDDLRAGRALSAFLTHRGWRERLGYRDLPEIDEREAGARLARLAVRHDLTVFEYYATDIAGHRPERLSPESVLRSLDGFFEGILAEWPAERPLIVVSDHGNLEDESHGRHTRNPALGLRLGPSPEDLPTGLTELAPILASQLGLPDPRAQSLLRETGSQRGSSKLARPNGR